MKDLPFSLVQLQYFATAAELGSMTTAASALNVSQSTVSAAIAQLEKDLGVQLLIRHHAKGLSLSSPGTKFYNELRNFLVHATEIADGGKYLGNSPAGDLNIGFFSVLSPFYLPDLVDEYEKIYPQVTIKAMESDIAGLVEKLHNGSIELALTYNIDLPHDIEFEILSQLKPYIITAANHPIAQRSSRSVSLQEFIDEPFILLDLPHSRNYFLDIFKQVGYSPNIAYRVSGFESVRSLVAHGRGFGLLNQRPHSSTTYDGGETAILEIAEDLPALQLVIARLKEVKITRKAAMLQNICCNSQIFKKNL